MSKIPVQQRKRGIVVPFPKAVEIIDEATLKFIYDLQTVVDEEVNDLSDVFRDTQFPCKDQSAERIGKHLSLVLKHNAAILRHLEEITNEVTLNAQRTRDAKRLPVIGLASRPPGP